MFKKSRIKRQRERAREAAAREKARRIAEKAPFQPSIIGRFGDPETVARLQLPPKRVDPSDPLNIFRPRDRDFENWLAARKREKKP
jgi:NAD(P)-dependent dehydrogenase (short-subunit alcohol dehydrogenase family)